MPTKATYVIAAPLVDVVERDRGKRNPGHPDSFFDSI